MNLYKVKVKYSYKSTDINWYTINANSEEDAKQKVIDYYVKCDLNDTDELLNYEILNIYDATPNYFLITLSLSNNDTISFPLKITTNEGIKEKINQRIQKQLHKYNKIHNINATIVDTVTKLISLDELDLFTMQTE